MKRSERDSIANNNNDDEVPKTYEYIDRIQEIQEPDKIHKKRNLKNVSKTHKNKNNNTMHNYVNEWLRKKNERNQKSTQKSNQQQNYIANLFDPNAIKKNKEYQNWWNKQQDKTKELLKQEGIVALNSKK
jgi:hypothetical protein